MFSLLLGFIFYCWRCVIRWCWISKGTVRPCCPTLYPCFSSVLGHQSLSQQCWIYAWLKLCLWPLCLWLLPQPSSWTLGLPLGFHQHGIIPVTAGCIWMHLDAVELCHICVGTASANLLLPNRAREVLLKVI